MDFFTEVMTLNCEQRIRVLKYFIHRIRTIDTQIKILRAPVALDYGCEVMPSLFLSDTLSFIRLKSLNQKENLLLKINRKDIQTVHKEFVDALWEKEENTTSDMGVLVQFMEEQLDGLQLLADAVGDNGAE